MMRVLFKVGHLPEQQTLAWTAGPAGNPMPTPAPQFHNRTRLPATCCSPKTRRRSSVTSLGCAVSELEDFVYRVWGSWLRFVTLTWWPEPHRRQAAPAAFPIPG